MSTKKRIIVCCDGTWQNSDNSYVKPSKSKPVPSLQIPSNVTRISRAFQRTCTNGTFQIIYYQSGVGSSGSAFQRMTGGAFGIGIAENIREAYSYICANYVDGDEIVLIGFSRGAFTARSIAGMISDLGLLTRDGMEWFYPIFKDMQNWSNSRYCDPFPDKPFPDKPKGSDASTTYRNRLVEKDLSRVREQGGTGDLIHVKAVAVWDTVGSLGIPDVPLLARLGVHRGTQEFKWFNTNISPKIEHAFHALSLDETRGPFSPAIWERLPGESQVTDLRQVWFPGSHANVGGGWPDQGMADITLAWMMDQLSSINVEFIPEALDQLFDRNISYYKALQSSGSLKLLPSKCAICCNSCCCGVDIARKPKYWATKQIEEANKPIRPWALHKISSAGGCLYDLAGIKKRKPGMYKKIDPETGKTTKTYLEDTNERIHSSVRVRLACEGLGVNDDKIWKCKPLLKKWRPRKVATEFFDPVAHDAEWGPQAATAAVSGGPTNAMNDVQGVARTTADIAANAHQATNGAARSATEVNPEASTAAVSIPDELSNTVAGQMRWVWEYVGREERKPPNIIIVEENIGPFESHLLSLAKGKEASVFDIAEGENFAWLDVRRKEKEKKHKKKEKK